MLNRWFFLVACLALIGYFAHHAIHGRYGLEARERAERGVKILEAELALLRAERERLERAASALTDDASRDDDLIEEQARRVVNFARPGDVILVIKPK
ncbi:MAG: septum formation initiator family protein [Hyphomicrobiales bacterium]|nr:septum formation initiator family protein [Hyphomicrobiales bacterium]